MGLLEDVSGSKMLPGTHLEVNHYTGQLLIHHKKEVVEKFHEALTGRPLHLSREEAFRTYTDLLIKVKCLRLTSPDEIVAMNYEKAESLENAHPGELVDLGIRDQQFVLIDDDFELKKSGGDSNWLKDPRFSAEFADPDFFSDSCWVRLKYAVPEAPNTWLDLDAQHFVPGRSQRFAIAGEHQVVVTVFLVSDFPIPSRKVWEAIHGTRLDDYDWSNQVFSFQEGRSVRFTLSDVLVDRFDWDFLYEPNRIGLGAFHPDVSLMARKGSEFNGAKDPVDPFAGATDESIGDRGGICDLGDVPLEKATLPENAEFVSFIPRPQRKHTYAIRNRHGKLAGFLRPLWVNFSKGDASSMRFHWRRVEKEK